VNFSIIVRENLNPEYHFGNLVIVMLLIAVLVGLSIVHARNFSHVLKDFVEKTQDFERRGAAPGSIMGLLRSCGRFTLDWWDASAGVITALMSVVAFGYIVPTLMLAASLAIGAWYDDEPAFESHAVDASRTISVVDIIETSVFLQADAATFGAVSHFKLFSPSHTIAASNLFGSVVLFAFGLVATVAGSLSFFSLAGNWLGNLFSRWIFKIEKYAKRRQGSEVFASV
jgi:hypothetical protein